MAWRQHDPKLWDRLVTEALEREERAMARAWPRLIGWDVDPAAVHAARCNVQRAGFAERIEIEERPLARLISPADHGLLITNPPYGERLGADVESLYLHRCLGTKTAPEPERVGSADESSPLASQRLQARNQAFQRDTYARLSTAQQLESTRQQHHAQITTGEPSTWGTDTCEAQRTLEQSRIHRKSAERVRTTQR